MVVAMDHVVAFFHRIHHGIEFLIGLFRDVIFQISHPFQSRFLRTWKKSRFDHRLMDLLQHIRKDLHVFVPVFRFGNDQLGQRFCGKKFKDGTVLVTDFDHIKRDRRIDA